MVRSAATFLGGTLFALSAASHAQPATTPDAARTPPNFDPASIRRQAAAMAEFKALLADPNQTVRLMAMREAIRAGNASQRQMAIEAGLSSNEAAMVEVALSGVLMNIQQIVIEFTDADGKVTGEGGVANYKMTMALYDSDTGRASGNSSCRGDQGKWSGQLAGTVFSFDTLNHVCSGTLNWSSDTGDFRGRINSDGGRSRGIHLAVWKPR